MKILKGYVVVANSKTIVKNKLITEQEADNLEKEFQGLGMDFYRGSEVRVYATNRASMKLCGDRTAVVVR